MAFDGNFCYALTNELKSLIGGKIEKIHHSGNACIELVVYTQKRTGVLVLSALPSAPYVSLTEIAGEHPQTPTMLCLLFRKHLQSAKILDVYALENERIICFECEGFDEIGHSSKKIIYAEIMGKYSNVVLCDDKKILGALHTSDITMSKRQIMVGMPYELPPKQEKLSAKSVSKERFFALCKDNSSKRAEKFLLETFLAFSPLICREIVFCACGTVDSETKNIDLEKFWFEFSKVVKAIQNGEFYPTIVYKNDIAYEYSFIDIRQYASGYKTKKFENLSSLLNEYYNSKKTAYLISEQSNELFKTINGKIAHVEKKITLQQTDLQQCEARDAYKVNGDLITANMYKIKQGDVSAECVDYSNGEIVSVPLDIRLSPAKNAQKYYKLYTKYKNAVVALTKQIEENKSEKKYLESVFDCLARAETEREIDELKIELETGGYIKKKGKKQKSKPLPPLVFTTSGGFCVRVGKNNIQNDMLTKSADKNDIWFHVKGFSGSHTILFVEDNNNQPNDIDLTEAAQLAAYHSSARGGSKIEVDYTLIRNVKKPSGAKPGFVTYEKQHTAIVDAKKPEICFDKNIL